jgi:hypothetical protein
VTGQDGGPAPPAADGGPGGSPVAGLALITPEIWWDVPLDPKTRHQAIAALVDERVQRDPRLADRRDELVSRLRRSAREAADAGGVLCSCMAMLAEDTAMSANLLVLIRLLAPDEAADATGDADALLGGLREGLDRDVTSAAPELGLAELPDAGRAVRLRTVRRTTLPLVDQTLPTLLVQYFVPLPAEDRRTAVVTFTSPSLAYEQPLVEMFDAIAQTLVFTGDDGEPIGPDGEPIPDDEPGQAG